MRSQFWNVIGTNLTLTTWLGCGTFDNFATISCQSGDIVHFVKSNCQMHTNTAVRDSIFKTKGTMNSDQPLYSSLEPP